jgi:hypothetical protein
MNVIRPTGRARSALAPWVVRGEYGCLDLCAHEADVTPELDPRKGSSPPPVEDGRDRHPEELRDLCRGH